MENEELMECLMYFSRWMPQDSVVRSRSIDDVIGYLRTECEFEILKLSSFVTTNLINFEKIKVSRFGTHPSPPSESTGEPFHLDNHE